MIILLLFLFILFCLFNWMSGQRNKKLRREIQRATNRKLEFERKRLKAENPTAYKEMQADEFYRTLTQTAIIIGGLILLGLIIISANTH